MGGRAKRYPLPPPGVEPGPPFPGSPCRLPGAAPQPTDAMARRRSLPTLLTLIAGALLGAPAAWAQLDLPDRPRPKPTPQKEEPKDAKEAPAAKKGDAGPVGEPQGIAAGAQGQETSTEVLRDAKGRPIGSRTVNRVNVPGAKVGSASGGQGGKRRGGSGGLDLPDRPRQPAEIPPSGEGAAPAAEAPPASDAPPAADVPSTAGAIPEASGAARVLLEQLEKVNRLGDPALGEIEARLAALGPKGLEVARYALLRPSAPMAAAGARVLLEAGSAEDHDLVVTALRGPLEPRAARVVLDDLFERDPTRGTNQLLTDLLSHDSAQVRRAAKAKLRGRVTADDLPALSRLMGARSTDQRRTAVELMARLDDELVTDHLLDALADRSASVSALASEALAASTDERVEFELLRRMMASGVIGRLEAKMALAVVEREDRLGKAILDDTALEPLLEGLLSPAPFISSTCAIALAGIGFRSERTSGMEWLDGPVPTELISVVAGVEFFRGFELSRAPALRRLRQITGQSLGSDGPAWARWWSDNRMGFRATRALMKVGEGDELRIALRIHDPSRGAPFTLAGPALAPEDSGFQEPEVGLCYFLLPRDARSLTRMLEEQGIFGATRLPGTRGAMGLETRSIEVRLGDQRKLFRVEGGLEEPWFQMLMDRAFGIARAQEWQQCLVPGEHMASRELFLEELTALGAKDGDEVDEHIEGVIMRHLVASDPKARGFGLTALERHDDAADTLSPEDLPGVLGLLEGEMIHGARGDRICELALRCIGRSPADLTVTDDGAAAAPSPEQRAGIMSSIEALVDAYGVTASPGVETLLAAADRAAVLAATRDQRIAVRIASARRLGAAPAGAPDGAPARGLDDEAAERLMALAYDEDLGVRVAALEALGERRVRRAFELVEERAKVAPARERAAALELLGTTRSRDAVNILMDALTSPDSSLHLPAARGLARVGTEETAPVLASLLGRRSSDAVRGVAREGLRRLGPLARRELLVAMRSPDDVTRRAATLMLAETLEPRALPELARLLTEDPADDVVALECAVLTCADFRDEPLPADGYFRFWEESRQKNALLWFRTACERRGLPVPEAEEFRQIPPGEGALRFLPGLIRAGDPDFIVLRARREFERLTGTDPGPFPRSDRRQVIWLGEVEQAIQDALELEPPAAPSGDASGVEHDKEPDRER